MTGSHAVDASRLLFAVVLLVPDLGLLGDLAGPRIGALACNAVHTQVGPAGLAAPACFGIARGAVGRVAPRTRPAAEHGR